jgi:uncharacterized membrane protein YfcA
MEILAYFIAVFIGVSLALIGGGGSTLTVPVLVYMMKVDPVLATTNSLFIVGFTSVVGGANAYRKKLIDFRAVSLFGIPSILSVFIARQYILPAIPAHIFSFENIVVTKGVLLMIIFAFLMLAAAISMILKRNKERIQAPDSDKHEPNLSLVVPGLVIGLITGLLGAGGGFLIIPTLVLILKMPMKTAVGTSLIIIAINCLFGFVFSIGIFNPDWKILLPFTALAITGVFIGSKLSEKISGETLTKGFGWFVLMMAGYILVRELNIFN